MAKENAIQKKATENIFKTPVLKEEWIKLHGYHINLQNELQTKQSKKTPINEKISENLLNKIDVNMGLMSFCKKGFNLPKQKIRKAMIFLKEKTNKKRIRYGALPDNIKPSTILFGNTTIVYSDKEDVIMFREVEVKSIEKISKIPKIEENPKILDGSEIF